MASILDEYEDSLHRSVSVQPGRASVGIPHSGTCAAGPPVCGGASRVRQLRVLCCLQEVCHRVCDTAEAGFFHGLLWEVFRDREHLIPGSAEC